MEIREIRLADFDELVKAAEEDGHAVIRPTHVAIRDGRIIGYASLAAVPLVCFWMDTKRATSVNTFRMEKYCEDVLRRHGQACVCAPCELDSPLHSYMGRLGFRSFGNADLFLKLL